MPASHTPATGCLPQQRSRRHRGRQARHVAVAVWPAPLRPVVRLAADAAIAHAGSQIGAGTSIRAHRSRRQAGGPAARATAYRYSCVATYSTPLAGVGVLRQGLSSLIVASSFFSRPVGKTSSCLLVGT